MSAPTKTFDVRVERVIPAPPGKVFDAWLDPKIPGSPFYDNDRLIG